MSDYNTVYITFKRRLTLIKLLVDSLSLDKESKERIKSKANFLLIQLDQKYDDGRILDSLEPEIIDLETTMKKGRE